MTISGAGFGTLPLGGSTLPYIAIQNETQGWQAGNSLNADEVGLNIASWTDNLITVNGFSFDHGNLVLLPNDHLTVWVCNPSSGNCGSNSVLLSESGAPELNVMVYNEREVTLAYEVKVDGTVVDQSIGDGGSTGWLAQTAGTHLVSEISTKAGFYNPVFHSGCDAAGRAALKPGEQPGLRDREHAGYRMLGGSALLLGCQFQVRVRGGLHFEGSGVPAVMSRHRDEMLWKARI